MNAGRLNPNGNEMRELATERPPRCHYGSLEQTIRSIRAHRPVDLNAERWRQSHPAGDFETWRREAHRCLHDGMYYDPGPLDLSTEIHETTERDGLVVETVAFSTTPWIRVNGYFLRPAHAREPLPGLVVFHAWGGPMLFGRERIVNARRDHPVLAEHRDTYYSGRYLAEELARAGYAVVVIDGRTPTEFKRMSIPNGFNVPNAELVYRVHDFAPDPKTTIVVNCAGRTRSIIGAQTLINAGLPNRIVALRGGTMGWQLAGLKLDHNSERSYGQLSDVARQKALVRANHMREHWNVRMIDRATLENWRAENSRTTYLLDVRSEDEFVAGHLPGSVFAPGGQLIQSTDQWCGTKGARIVLLDNKTNL